MSTRDEHHGATGDVTAVSLDVTLHAGCVRVHGGDQPGVRVRIEADPSPGAPWWGGVAGVVGRVEEYLTGEGPDPAERARRAVAATVVTWDEAGVLRVVAPEDRSLRSVPLTVTVAAAEIAALRVRAGAAEVRADVAVGEVDIEGTGAVDLVETRGRAGVRCGAAAVRVGTTRGALRVRGGAGEVAVDHVLGAVEVVAGAGRVRLGEVRGDVAVRLAGGEVAVADVVSGDLELTTGAGRIDVGVRAGVDARLDLRTLTGRARSELPVHAARVGAADRPAGDPVRVRARSNAGDVVVRAALSPSP